MQLKLTSYQGFCGATFIIGSGLGTLESAANPYLAGEQDLLPIYLYVLTLIS